MLTFHSIQVVVLDTCHTASKSHEKITNSNGNILDLIAVLFRAHQTAKQACGLACILGSLLGKAPCFDRQLLEPAGSKVRDSGSSYV